MTRKLHFVPQFRTTNRGGSAGLVRRHWRLVVLAALGILLPGCVAIHTLLAPKIYMPRPNCDDEIFARQVHSLIETLPLPGLYELRTTAAGGHVTLGGRVDSPATLQQLVTGIAATPGLCELSFFGMEFCPPDVPDYVVVEQGGAAAIKRSACRSRTNWASTAKTIAYSCTDNCRASSAATRSTKHCDTWLASASITCPSKLYFSSLLKMTRSSRTCGGNCGTHYRYRI